MTEGENILVSRVAAMIKKAEPGNIGLRTLGARIGLLLENEAKLNVRRRHLIDTGNLINSISHRLEADDRGIAVRAGSFGVPYARIHEYGFSGPEQVKAHQRLQTMAFGRPMQKPRKVDVRGHVRIMAMPIRAYLRPAFDSMRDRILEIVQEYFKGK